MSFEELMQEHIKALRENTNAIIAYTKAVNTEANNGIEVEHTKDSACRFCGVTYKTLQFFIESGLIIPCRRKNRTREYFKEKDLVNLCETKQLYSGDYGKFKEDPTSRYYSR